MRTILLSMERQLSGTKTIDKALLVLKKMLVGGQCCSAEQVAKSLDLPLATAYRHIAALERQGFLRRESKSTYTSGMFLLSTFDPEKFNALLTQAAQPVVESLADRLQLISHLGAFEKDMVSYLVKAGPEKDSIFTRESTQLDAYCSGLGKVLLANLSAPFANNYLTSGILPALTKNTITDVNILRQEMAAIRNQGYAIDNSEFDESLYCLAIPVIDRDSRVIAALSVSSRSSDIINGDKQKVFNLLQSAANNITKALYGWK